MQLALFPEPRFRGRTFNPQRDQVRLESQQERVTALMADGRWRTLQQISAALGYPEASISARLRDARRSIHGGWIVERERVPGGNGLWRYRMRKP